MKRWQATTEAEVKLFLLFSFRAFSECQDRMILSSFSHFLVMWYTCSYDIWADLRSTCYICIPSRSLILVFGNADVMGIYNYRIPILILHLDSATEYLCCGSFGKTTANYLIRLILNIPRIISHDGTSQNQFIIRFCFFLLCFP